MVTLKQYYLCYWNSLEYSKFFIKPVSKVKKQPEQSGKKKVHALTSN